MFVPECNLVVLHLKWTQSSLCFTPSSSVLHNNRDNKRSFRWWWCPQIMMERLRKKRNKSYLFIRIWMKRWSEMKGLVPLIHSLRAVVVTSSWLQSNLVCLRMSCVQSVCWASSYYYPLHLVILSHYFLVVLKEDNNLLQCLKGNMRARILFWRYIVSGGSLKSIFFNLVFSLEADTFI